MAYFDEQREIVALPPAFICAGAAAVVGTFWPVEEVSTALIIERFIYHLMDPGEFPATALFTACKDIRNLSREAVGEYCNEVLCDMEKRQVHEGAGAEAYIRLTAFAQRIHSGPEKPFESPFFWGGFFVTGCGWYMLEGKGELRIEPDRVLDLGMAIQEVKYCSGLFKEGKYAECIPRLEAAVKHLDGLWLGRAFLLLSDSLYRVPDMAAIFEPKKAMERLDRALAVCNQAYDILLAKAEEQKIVSL
jgi:hypothetical protein